jgi:hypothetical protein
MTVVVAYTTPRPALVCAVKRRDPHAGHDARTGKIAVPQSSQRANAGPLIHLR